MPWVGDAGSILQSWFPGQEFGNSLSDIIFGKINPSGKLPTTFPKSIKDTPAYATYPGKDLQMDYEEGLYIGYRWYEKEEIEPLFPFGHGLSYTSFEYSNLRALKFEYSKDVYDSPCPNGNNGSISSFSYHLYPIYKPSS